MNEKQDVAAVSCSLNGYYGAGVGFGIWLMGKLGRVWVGAWVSAWCMGSVHGVVHGYFCFQIDFTHYLKP